MELTAEAKELYELLYTKSFSADKLKAALDSVRYDADAVNLAAFRYVEDCSDESDNDDDLERVPGVVIPGSESSHMLEAMQILLNHGLDPNRIYIESCTEDFREENNIMSELRFVDNGYIAADTLALLLEHGGDPSLKLNDASLIRDINFDLVFDLYEIPLRFHYDALVHYWMVMVGYGARLEKGEPTVDPCKGFDIAELKNHRNYYYGAIESDRSGDHMEICFFDKRTNLEVARF